jgi:leucyl-tRNA synthetase
MTIEEPKGRYDFNGIEKKWQEYWDSRKTFKAAPDKNKPKYYVLDMFPYPSAQGLHVGHPEGYTASDIVSRYKRMKGFAVLHPMGWDAFGLPAEQYARQTGTHPAVTTKNNIDNMRRQIKSLGFSYDWDREVATTDEDYYKWTQWIFLKLFNSYFDEAQQKARPIEELAIPAGLSDKDKREYIDGQRLAYEEVIGGLSERGGHPVFRKPLRQWMLRITKYAERLLADLDGLDWSEGIKKLQADWVGKSVGAEVDFKVAGHDATIRVFTTRPDTLFGATYMVMAPEHRLIDAITTADKKTAVEEYRGKAASKSDMDRTDLAKDKTGQFTGACAINPVNGKEIPIWISDYVLISYGTGAIMSVPAHDDRDFEFAKKFDLPIIPVVEPPCDNSILRGIKSDDLERNKQRVGVYPMVGVTDFSEQSLWQAYHDEVMNGQLCYSGDGVAVNSGEFTGLKTADFKEKISTWLEKQGLGKKAVNYKLRDWIFSRQHYWGEPFPILHIDGNVVGMSESDLPLVLPKAESYKPSATGESPLATIDEWLNITLPDGRKARRETNTMPQWAGSCWYYLRYLDPKNDKKPWDKDKENYWMPVDLYIGGAEHAVLHLLYSRFWHKLLFDLGYVSTKEPFQKLVNQGMILGADNQKMSKSRGNVVNPDDVISQYGADSMRLYEMFMGPLEATKPWSMQGVEGVHRFLQRVWRCVVNEDSGQINKEVCKCEPDAETLKKLHQTIKKVTADIESFGFNTAISQMMIFINHLSKQDKRPVEVIEKFVLVLAPFSPHMAEELWQRLGHSQSLAYEPWPAFDPELCKEKQVEIAVQVNGKIRDKITVDADESEENIKAAALACEKVVSEIAGRQPKKVIVIKSRLVNIVC